MNATILKPAWTWAPAKVLRLKRRQGGFARFGPPRNPELPIRVANAHARFEHEARMALREWLMV